MIRSRSFAKRASSRPVRLGFGLSSVLAAAAASAVLSLTATANADVSSWLYLGTGPAWLSQQGSSYDLATSLQMDFGVGSSPSKPVVLGGLVRVNPYLGHGSDLALVARAATRGFATGDWGLALDGGGFERWWGKESSGALGALQLGAPFGLTLGLQGEFGTDSTNTFSATLGVDLLRLTVTRLGGNSSWYNPRPAWNPSPAQP